MCNRCAEAQTALAIVVVPFGVEAKVEDTLYQMMAGACSVLRESNCALVGGHTCEGSSGCFLVVVCVCVRLCFGSLFGAALHCVYVRRVSVGVELSLGFVINGVVDPDDVLTKGGMKLGDQLVLTKPVGTGTLFAADMRGQATGRDVANALAGMQQSNREAGICLRAHGSTSCTDVTGFGLLGHLFEMAKASDAKVQATAHSVV